MTGTLVVVGGASGIGASVARLVVSDESVKRLVVADVDQALAESTATQARAISPDTDVASRHVDLTDGSSVGSLLEVTADADRVVISAGIFDAASSLDVEMDAFRRVLEVNLVGVFHAAQLYSRHMVERGGGVIVGVASIAARMPRMRQAAYSASKAGLRQALRVLAMEVAPAGVRINTVSPGPTDTPMMRELAQDHSSVHDLASGSSEAFRPRIPHGRVATPDDIAHAVAFLLSPGAEHVHMHDLVVDGGEMLGM